MAATAFYLGRLIRLLAPLLILLAGVGGLVTLAKSRERPEPRDVEAELPLVETTPVALAEPGLDLPADGLVIPFRSIVLSSEVEGRVVEKSENCREGRAVKSGELLLRVDPASYDLKIERFTSERDQAKANLAELAVQVANTRSSIDLAKEDVALNKADLERVRGLERRGVSTSQALETAQRGELASRTNVVKLENEKRLLEAQKTRWEQGVRLAEAQLAEAQLDRQRTVIRAPADGVIAGTNVERDGYVRVGDKLATVEDTAAVEVRTNLEMRVIAWLRAHLPPETQEALGPYDLPPVPVMITYEILGNVYSWRGTLSRVDGYGLDERTRTVPCRVHVAQPRSVSLQSGSSELPIASPPALVSGMYVRLQLHTATTEPLLSIPEVAVHPDNSVWAVRDGKLAHFKLPAARVTRGAVLVAPQVTKLKAGDAVVVSPLKTAVEGTLVRTKDFPPGGEDADDASLTASHRARNGRGNH